jgi:transcription antitermination factor NusG
MLFQELTEQQIGANAWEAGPQWYALNTRSNFEKQIAAELKTKGIEHYLPAYDEVHQWKDRKKKITVPLFPGYLFARFLDEPHLRLKVLATAGVVRILGNGGGIEPVPEEQVEAVRAILNSRLPHFRDTLLSPGTRVRVMRGALAGLEGTLVRTKRQARLVITIPLLGQSIAAEVTAADVEAIGRN